MRANGRRVKYCDTCRSAYPNDFNTCPRDQAALRKRRREACFDAGEAQRLKAALRRLYANMDALEDG